uniref:Arrestin domain-containing protein 2 n=1 Tax=Cacopsylla melanoneura TaxID=428564 RepID=A0A8D9AD50_9HEMI
MKEFRVEFDSPTKAYYTGQVVTGRVILNLNKPKAARAIKITCSGESLVKFKDHKVSHLPRNYTIYFTSKEVYFNDKLMESYQEQGNIPQGSHVYHFSCTLPTNIPSSFKKNRSHVRYTIKATLDRPWALDDHAEEEFIVVNPYNLNTDMKAKEPIHQETSKNYVCLTGLSGLIQIVLTAPYTGVVPGQTLPINISIDNKSSVIVDKVKIKLTKTLRWRAKNPISKRKVTKLDLTKETLDGVGAHSSRSWNHQFVVPMFEYVNLSICKYIEQEFELSVTAEAIGLHLPLVLKVPIIIGSIPLQF